MPNEKIDILEKVRNYVQEDYWENGVEKGCSGYQSTLINWWWVNRWMQCFTQVFPVVDQRILDLGCGYGSMVAGFQTWGGDAYGIDISDYAIKSGVQQAPYLEHRIFQGSIHDLSRFETESFDIIYSNQVFEHLPEQYVESMISEMWRVTKPGGQLFLSFVTSVEENGVRGADDNDETHINIHNMDWWRKRFFQKDFYENIERNERIRSTVTGYDHLSYFKEHGWDSIVLGKKR